MLSHVDSQLACVPWSKPGRMSALSWMRTASSAMKPLSSSRSGTYHGRICVRSQKATCLRTGDEELFSLRELSPGTSVLSSTPSLHESYLRVIFEAVFTPAPQICSRSRLCCKKSKLPSRLLFTLEKIQGLRALLCCSVFNP